MGDFPSGQRGQTVNLLLFSFGGPNPPSPTKNPKATAFGFFSCAARHNIICVAHATSFEHKLNFIAARAAQMNDVALRANDVLRNDVVTVCKQTAPNEVALRANGIKPFVCALKYS